MTTFLEYLNTIELSEGLGTVESPCSIAAYNLFSGNGLTDKIPECMCDAIGNWAIMIQDHMPDFIRNSKEWKEALSMTPYTGKDKERKRLDMILDWMWNDVLPMLLPLARQKRFGKEWSEMLKNKNIKSAKAAARAALLAARLDATEVAYYSVASATSIKLVVDVANEYNTARTAGHAALAASYAALAASYAADAVKDADDRFWLKINPAKLLRELCEA